MGIRIIAPHERIVVFRLGRADASSVRGPGRTFLVPFIDHAIAVDLREQSTSVTCLATTLDEVPISVDLIMAWRIVDPLKCVLNVANFPAALFDVAARSLGEVMAEIRLEEAQTRRDRVVEALRTTLEPTIERWGGRLSGVDIVDIVKLQPAI